jgi:transaldolase / glucose-6-phosphate isomerase
VAVETAAIVERIWERDASLWTGGDEDKWLGWLDAPLQDPPEVPDLEFDDCVLLGMGGSSLAPEVMRRAAGGKFYVLDTTHPDAIRSLEDRIDPDRTLFVAASKSGTTLETRCHIDYFWREGRSFAAITDPGSELETLARDRAFAAVFLGDPAIGGRYSALSPFGIVPARLLGLDVEGLLDRARRMRDACRSVGDNPGLELGFALGEGWRDGRDKVVVPEAGGFGMWLEQLLAESTGKDGKGLVPAPGEDPDGPDRQWHDVRINEPLDLGTEAFRWEFATAVAGAVMEINPFDQPNVQEAKDRTNAILEIGQEPELDRVGSLDELLAQANPGDYLCVQAFVEPTAEAWARIERVLEQVRTEFGIVTTAGFGPRYLHSTGQLHKGGPPSGLFLQVVDDPEELPIPGRPYGFRRLIRAQAAGDFEALRERGRRVARVMWEDVA